MLENVIYSQTFCWTVYLMGSLCVGGMLGVLCVSMPKILSLPEATRFLLGFSCTPYVLGIYTLFLSFLPLKLPNIVYILPIYIVAVVILFLKSKMILKLLAKGLFAEYSIEVKVILAAAICGVFSNAISQAMYNAGVRGIKEHRTFISGVCSMLVFAFFLGIFFYAVHMETAKKLRKKTIGLFFSLNFIYICTYYLGVTGAGKYNKSVFVLLFIIALGFLLFLNLTYMVYDKVRFTKKRNRKIAVLYVIALIVLVRLKAIFHSLFTNIAVGEKTAVQRLFSQSLFCVAVIFGFIIIYYFFCTVDKEKNILMNYNYEKVKTFTIHLLVLGVTILTIAQILYLITSASFAPVIGADANQYMSEALTFAEEMKNSSMNSYQGSADGSLIANIHHPTWVAYLSNAMLHNFNAKLGFPNDFAMRLAFQLNYVYLITAVWAFARMLSKNIVPCLSIIFMFLYDGMFYIYTSASRDAFRLIAIFAFCIIIMAMDKKIDKSMKFDFKFAVMLFLVCSFVMMGHPINAITALSVVASYSIFILMQKRFSKNVLKYYFVAALGALIGSYQMISAFLETGKMTGRLIDMDKILEGTDYYVNYMNYTEGRLKGTTSYLERLNYILLRDQGLLSVLGLVCAVLIVIFFARRREKIKETYFLSMIVLVNGVFLTDVFGWSGIKLTEWCVMNARYTLQFYIFWGIEIACVFMLLLKYFFKKTYKCLTIFGIVLLIYSFLPFCFVQNNYSKRNLIVSHNKYVNNYMINREVQQQLGDKRILIDNFYMNYYLDNKALSFFTEPAKDIRMAKNEKELYRKLCEKDIGAILITNSYVDIYWKKSLMEEFLNSEFISKCVETDANKVYILNYKYFRGVENEHNNIK